MRLPLERIAELSGFAHMEYLSYFFKRTMDLSPRAYRGSNPRHHARPDATVAGLT